MKLGCPLGAQPFEGKRELGAQRAGETHIARADDWAEKRRPVIAELVTAGLSNNGIARELTARKINTPRGGRWTATSVQRLRQRLGLIDATSILEAA